MSPMSIPASRTCMGQRGSQTLTRPQLPLGPQSPNMHECQVCKHTRVYTHIYTHTHVHEDLYPGCQKKPVIT